MRTGLAFISSPDAYANVHRCASRQVRALCLLNTAATGILPQTAAQGSEGIATLRTPIHADLAIDAEKARRYKDAVESRDIMSLMGWLPSYASVLDLGSKQRPFWMNI